MGAEITLVDGRVQQTNFHQHPMMRMRQSPKMEIFWRTHLGTFFHCVVATALHAPSLIGIRIVRPLYALGVVSYGIYLWHSFAIQYCLMHPGLSNAQALLATLVLTVVLSVASWRLFEKRILEYGRKLGGGRSSLRALLP